MNKIDPSFIWVSPKPSVKMGVHDFSCVMCSEEGSQLAGQNQAYLVITNLKDKNLKPLEVLKCQEFIVEKWDYSSDHWDFYRMNAYLGYDTDVLSQNYLESYSIWYSTQKSAWIINLCSDCWKYLSTDQLPEGEEAEEEEHSEEELEESDGYLDRIRNKWSQYGISIEFFKKFVR